VVASEDAQHAARRVTAILVVEHVVAQAGAVVPVDDATRFFRAAGGDAEPVLPRTVVAIFEDAPDAATAATKFHLTTSAFWRAGLDVGEVFMTPEAGATRTALDRATALARLARPGTTAVAADGVAALGALRHADIEPLEDRVCLLVPRPPGPELRQRRATMVLLGGAALAGITWLVTSGMRSDPPRRLTLGVGPFRTSGSHGPLAWIGPALRGGLSAELSELTGVQVFSDEFLDFAIARENLTAIELATRLGIEKIVSGSVIVVGDTVRVEARVIDVASGVLEGAYSTSGREQDFLALERDLVAGVVARLDLPLSPEERARLAAGRTTNADALRRLLDAEGAPRIEPPPPTESGEPHSAPWDLGPRSAHAGEPDAEVMALLREYREATERRDVEGVAALYVDLSAGQRAALERFFANVRDLKVAIDRVDALVVGDEAVVNYTRTDDFIDVPTSQPQHVSVRLTKSLRRVGGRWRFTAAR
jgi:TolB-like protein